MPKVIDYYLSLTSPWTYMGDARLRDIAHRHDAVINHKPVRLGEIFSMSGGLPLPKRAPQRQAYRMLELKRWRRRLGVDLNLEPKFFPAPDSLSARMVLAAKIKGTDVANLVHAIMRAVWAEEKDQTDSNTLVAIADGLHLDGKAFLAGADTDEVRILYDRYTEEAKVAGVFGAPGYVIDGELFWGQDRLDFVAEKLKNEGD